MILKKFPELKNILYRYVRLSAILFICFWLTRIFEIINFFFAHERPDFFGAYEFYGFLFDTYTGIVLSGFLIIPFFLLSLWKEKAGLFFYAPILFILVLINIFLSAYFVLVLEPLDFVVFTYTPEDLLFAGKSSSGTELYKGIIFLVIGAFVVFRLIKSSQGFRIGKTASIFFILIAISSIFFFHKAFFNNNRGELKNYLTNNKLSYFLISSYDNYQTLKVLNRDDNKSISFLTENFSSWTNKDDQYPLLHKENTPDVLGNYFNLDKRKKPNIVFIIAESLSKAVVGENSRLGNFTPFLDSLSRHSLYWPNFLSTAERTFGVLPSSLGSLPYGTNGFMDISNEKNFPNHLTSLRLLKQQGYYTRFYVGCWTHFNNMDGFMKAQNIDYIVKNWNSKYKEMEKYDNGFTWGYPDMALFQKSFEDIDSMHITQPRFDILLTVSNHHPFSPPNKKYYIALAEKQFSKIGLSEEQKSAYKKDMAKFSSVMYADDAIRQYFKTYQQRADYNNTIFFIYGDHAMPELEPNKPALEKYHVPLIIYSPMLKSSEKFLSVSSQLNLSPSLLALLRDNYQMKFPEKVHWLAGALDTGKEFRNTQVIPFMLNNKDLVEFINKDYFISYDNLYKIQPGLEIEKVEDKSKLSALKEQLQSFAAINYRVCFQNKILPQKEYQAYTPEDFMILEIKKDEIDNLNSSPEEYNTVIDNYRVVDTYEDLILYAEFEYYVSDTAKKNSPCLVMTLDTGEKERKNLCWTGNAIKRKDGSALEKNKWNAVICERSVNLKEMKGLPKQYFVSSYFWNNKKIKYKIKDVRLELKGYK